MSKKSAKRKRRSSKLRGIISGVASLSRDGRAQTGTRIGQSATILLGGPRYMPTTMGDVRGQIAFHFHCRFPAHEALEKKYGVDDAWKHRDELTPAEKDEDPVWAPEWKQPEDLELQLLSDLIAATWKPVDKLHILELLAREAL